MRELFEKLVEVLRISGEQVAVFPHELLEARVQRLPLAPLLHHPVEGVKGVADVLALLGTRRGRRPGQLVEIGLHDLFAQPLEELFEVLPRFGRGELVALQPVHAAGEILREQPELRPSLTDGVLGHLAAPLVARVARFLLELVQLLVLLIEDLVELVGDVLVDAAEVVLLPFLPPAFTDPLEQLLHALDVPAVAVLESLLQEAA